MKSLIFICFILFLFSCKKDDPGCYVCQTESKGTSGIAVIRQSNTKTIICDLSGSQILEYESSRTGTTITHEQNGIYGTITVTTVSNCHCVKQ